MTGSEAIREGVSICGLGAVTGYGWGQKHLREGILSGESSVSLTPGYGSHFETESIWVSQVKDEGEAEDGPSRFTRATRYAAREAYRDAYDRGWRPGEVVGIVGGFVLGDVDLNRAYHRRHGYRTSRRGFLELMPSTVLTGIAKEFDMHGPSIQATSMCASGVSGLLLAKSWLEAGLASDVLVFTSDISASPENCRAFSHVGALVCDAPPLEACRPYQEGSRGPVAGEAVVAMIVTKKRDGSYGTVRGGGMTQDGFHPVSIAPDHVQVIRAFKLALDNSGVAASEVAYLNGHGTGTKQCDEAEADAFDRLFPNAEGLFSMKPLFGHCQGAAAAVETIATLHGFETGVIPAPPQRAPGHPKLLDGATPAVKGAVAKSSLGMGGHNAVMILEPPTRP